MSDTCNDNLSTQEFYKDKYAIVIDLKTVDENSAKICNNSAKF